MTDIFEKFSLIGKTAIITGGAGLLGSQFSKTLAQAGAKVIIADSNIALASRVAENISLEGGWAKARQVNVTNAESINQMVKDAHVLTGSIDILVNSAALDPKFDPDHTSDNLNNAFENYPIDAWQSSIDVNLTGVFLCSQAVVRIMKKQGQGVLINICSIYGLVGPDQSIYPEKDGIHQFKPVDYSVTKAGILGLTRYLASYYSGTKIRVNALTPGGVYNQHDEEFSTKYSSHTILGRMAQIDELNGALLFLASDASSYMTGANLVVDGGWTAW